MILVGHRGAKGEAPENTVAGFEYARSLGIEAIELDVRLSADEQLVIMHDSTVERTTDGRGPVSSLTAAELAKLDARAEHPTWPSPVGVPTLAAAFAAVPDLGHWEVEIKSDAPARLERICALLPPTIDRFGLRERVTISSFDPAALALIAEVAPHLPRCFIGAYDRPVFLETAQRLGCVRAAIPLKSGSAAMVQAARAAGLRVSGWQGNTPEDVRTLVEWGVDQITTDFPTMALGALRDA
jgi:glycerophosphoryl diester phosphodiesterase